MDFTKLITAVFYNVFQHRRTLTKALVIPFLLTILLDSLSQIVTDGMTSFLISLLQVMVYTIFAIVVHRVLLIGDNSVPTWGVGKWTKRETFFAINLVILGIVISVVGSVVMLPIISMGVAYSSVSGMIFGGLIILLVIGWLFARLSLVFPSIALDEKIGLDDSWSLTKPYQLLMLSITMIPPLILGTPLFLLWYLGVNSYFVVESILAALFLVFEIAAISMVYQWIVKDRENLQHIGQSE